MSDNTIATYLRENPRLMGVLFTACLLLGQAGSVAANHAEGLSGP
jgi:hypothetical protein